MVGQSYVRRGIRNCPADEWGSAYKQPEHGPAHKIHGGEDL